MYYVWWCSQPSKTNIPKFISSRPQAIDRLHLHTSKFSFRRALHFLQKMHANPSQSSAAAAWTYPCIHKKLCVWWVFTLFFKPNIKLHHCSAADTWLNRLYTDNTCILVFLISPLRSSPLLSFPFLFLPDLFTPQRGTPWTLSWPPLSLFPFTFLA